jgi:hypothetical protein
MHCSRTFIDVFSLLSVMLALGGLSAGCLSGMNASDASENASHEAFETDTSAHERADAGAPVAAASGWDAATLGPWSTTDAAIPMDAASATSPEAAVAGPTGSGLPCKVEAIVAARCGLCHGKSARFGAPMSLTRQPDFQALAVTDGMKRVRQVVQERINAATKPMPPADVPPLMADELTTLNDWLGRGALESDERCAPVRWPDDMDIAGNEVDTSNLDCYRFVAYAPGDKAAKYPVGVAVDSWMNMTFKAEWQGDGYVQVIRPVVDNAAAVHHWALYIEPGTDGNVEPGTGVHAGGQRVAGWGPGGSAVDFRRFGDLGLPLPSTTYVLDIHYNSMDPEAVDASGAELCMSKTRPKTLLGNTRLGYVNSILVGDFGGPRTTWTGVCKPESQEEPIHIVYGIPHMHRTGRRITSVITAVDGTTRTLLDKPYEFENQNGYDLDAVLMPGESITTTCTFSEPKSFGQGTNDEMCYLFSYSYPAGALVDNSLLAFFQGTVGDSCVGQ